MFYESHKYFLLYIYISLTNKKKQVYLSFSPRIVKKKKFMLVVINRYNQAILLVINTEKTTGNNI